MANNNSLLMIGGAVAAVGIGYVVMKGRCEDGDGPDFLCDMLPGTGPSIPPDVMTQATLADFVAKGRSLGLTDAQIQLKLDEFVAQKKACVTPSTWKLETSSCMGGSLVAGPPPPLTQPYIPPTVPPPPSLPPVTDPVVAALAAAAAGDAFFVGGKANADHWAYYWNRLHTPITGAQFTAAFGVDRGPQSMTASEFIGRIRAVGLSGFRMRVPGVLGGISSNLLGIRVPGFGLGRTVQHNFFGTMIAYAGAEDIMAELARSWQSARGNGTGFACRDLQRDPSTAARALIDITVDHCNLAPEACQGVDVPGVAGELASDYADWFNRTFPKGWGDCYNYDAATFAAKFPGASQADYWFSGPPGGSVSVAPAPTPPVMQQQQPLNNPPAVLYITPPPPPPASVAAPPPAPAPGPAANNTAPKMDGGFDFGGSVKIGDFDVPYWALGIVAVGAFMYMKGAK